jgi:hypothetical protein
MGNRDIITIAILCVLTGFITFLYLMKNSSIFPDNRLLRSEDENLLIHYLIAAIAVFLIVLLSYLYLLNGYFENVL